jgi:hypothetical protein
MALVGPECVQFSASDYATKDKNSGRFPVRAPGLYLMEQEKLMSFIWITCTCGLRNNVCWVGLPVPEQNLKRGM